MRMGKIFVSWLWLLALPWLAAGVAEASADKPLATVSGKCVKCHTEYKDQADIVAGDFDSLSDKAKTIQVDLGDRKQLMKFTDQTTVKNVPAIKDLKKPIPVKVTYQKVGDEFVAKEISAKPQIKVPDDKVISTEDLKKLVAMGPEKGKYTLVDSRPPVKYEEGHIPTAILMPFAQMADMTDKLPKDKNALLIFYCDGMR